MLLVRLVGTTCYTSLQIFFHSLRIGNLNLILNLKTKLHCGVSVHCCKLTTKTFHNPIYFGFKHSS